MTRWEYHKIMSGTCPAITTFNELGDEGWELVTTSYGNGWHYFIFKRPAEEIQAKAPSLEI